MKFHRLVSLLTIVCLLAIAPGAALVSAQEPVGTPATEEAAPAAEPTQETTVAATEEVTIVATEVVTPTEEVTVEPTQEATVEPTQEVTVEPTQEVTVEPTVEVTVEPTEEATVEPTEEVTVEPTVEVTVEPTEEATVEPTATITPTEVPATPTAETSGEISAQAIPGTWSSEYIAVQNLGAAEASGALDLYLQGNSASANTKAFTIPVGGAVAFPASSISVDSGAYAGIVSSSEQAAAAVFNVNRTGKVGDMYLGFSSPAISQTLPLIYRNHASNKSKFYIQNTTSASQTVTIKAYMVGSSTPSATVSYGVDANTSITVDFMNSAFDGFGSGEGHYGYAIVQGASGNIAVVHETTKDTGADASTLQTLYDGFNIEAAGTDLVAPLVYNNHYDWKTGITVVNLGSEATTVQMAYYSNKGNGSASIAAPAHAAILFWMPTYTPAASYGAVTLHSTNANSKIVAVANNTNLKKGSGSALAVLNRNTATNDVAFPMVFNGASGWQVGITVYAVEAGNLQATWVKSNVDPAGAGNTIAPAATAVAANSVTLYFGPYILPSNYVGSVRIHSTGKILAVANFPNTSLLVGGQMPGYSYNP